MTVSAGARAGRESEPSENSSTPPRRWGKLPTRWGYGSSGPSGPEKARYGDSDAMRFRGNRRKHQPMSAGRRGHPAPGSHNPRSVRWTVGVGPNRTLARMIATPLAARHALRFPTLH